MVKMTQIQVSEETREALAARGKKRESYDDIIIRLMKLVDG